MLFALFLCFEGNGIWKIIAFKHLLPPLKLKERFFLLDNNGYFYQE